MNKEFWILDTEMKDCPDGKSRLARTESPQADGVSDQRFIRVREVQSVSKEFDSELADKAGFDFSCSPKLLEESDETKSVAWQSFFQGARWQHSQSQSTARCRCEDMEHLAIEGSCSFCQSQSTGELSELMVRLKHFIDYYAVRESTGEASVALVNEFDRLTSKDVRG